MSLFRWLCLHGPIAWAGRLNRRAQAAEITDSVADILPSDYPRNAVRPPLPDIVSSMVPLQERPSRPATLNRRKPWKTPT